MIHFVSTEYISEAVYRMKISENVNIVDKNRSSLSKRIFIVFVKNSFNFICHFVSCFAGLCFFSLYYQSHENTCHAFGFSAAIWSGKNGMPSAEKKERGGKRRSDGSHVCVGSISLPLGAGPFSLGYSRWADARIVPLSLLSRSLSNTLTHVLARNDR